MMQQCSTSVWQGWPLTQAMQAMLHHHEWAEMPSLLCHSWPAIMCIHGSHSLAILLQVHEVDIGPWRITRLYPFRETYLHISILQWLWNTSVFLYLNINTCICTCHMISVHGDLSHDLTAKLKHIPRPTAVSHASWAWAVNATKFPIKLLWKQWNGRSRQALMIQTEIQWYIDVIILEVCKYMW